MRVTLVIAQLQLFVMVYLNICAMSKPRSSSPFTLICLGLPLLFLRIGSHIFVSCSQKKNLSVITSNPYEFIWKLY